MAYVVRSAPVWFGLARNLAASFNVSPFLLNTTFHQDRLKFISLNNVELALPETLCAIEEDFP